MTTELRRLPLPVGLLLLLAAMWHTNVAFISEYHKNFNFSCPDGHALMTIDSNDLKGDDRLFHFDCYDMEEAPLKNCFWGPYENQFQKPVNFRCGADRVVAGVATNYSAKFRDRMWMFRCCELEQSYIIHNCRFTAPLNNISGQIQYRVPEGDLISGIAADVDTRAHDRLFTLDICKLDQIRSVVGRR